MELRQLPEEALLPWYERELTEAFPPNERKPLADILALIHQGRYQVWGLFQEEKLLGYATLWMEPTDQSCILLDYLGVTAAQRNGGLGQKIVRMLAERLAGRSLLLIEAECPVEGDDPAENTLRQRRQRDRGRRHHRVHRRAVGQSLCQQLGAVAKKLSAPAAIGAGGGELAQMGTKRIAAAGNHLHLFTPPFHGK